jgi:hypothetical protein
MVKLYSLAACTVTGRAIFKEQTRQEPESMRTYVFPVSPHVQFIICMFQKRALEEQDHTTIVVYYCAVCSDMH